MNETVILLHGFPASAGSWKPVATKLAAHHLRVLALEQRGYSPGAQPKDLRSYIIDELVEDVLALLQATNTQAAHIVGHDWGGAVAWAFASRYPEHTLSLTSVSTPHPNAFSQALHSSKQALMSWYMFFFQLPFLPEWIMRANQGKLLTRYLVHSGLNEKAALSYTRRMLGNNTLHYALAWYRALRFKHRGPTIDTIKSPTLFIYGGKDAYLSEKAARLTRQQVTGKYIFMHLPEATHWIPEEQPDLLAKELLGFIKNDVQV
jgi:pimeloyl-ACP methyl ester carboxylesterase